MAEKEQSEKEITGSVVNIKDYAKRMLKSDYDAIVSELLPNDVILFTEKYLNGKTDKELKLNQKDSKILKEKLIKIILKIKSNSLHNISETQLRYRCRKLNKSKDYADFCVDAFVHRYSNRDLGDKYFLSIETVKHYKVIRKKELINF